MQSVACTFASLILLETFGGNLDIFLTLYLIAYGINTGLKFLHAV
jgi:hypothetical protein